MTQMADVGLVRRVQYIEKKLGLTQVERQKEKGNRDKGRGRSRRFEKEIEGREPAKRIDITV